MTHTEIPTSLRDLFASWSDMPKADQFRAYVDVPVTPAILATSYAEAKAASKGLPIAGKGWYAARAFHIWLHRFADTQAYLRSTGALEKLTAKAERERQLLLDAGLPDAEIDAVMARAA